MPNVVFMGVFRAGGSSMTFYLVKYATDDFRLHEEDGSELGSWNERPTETEMASSLKSPWRFIVEGYCFRDVEEWGMSEVPWGNKNNSP